MGEIINANKEEFEKIIKSEKGVVLVDFYAEWCAPCKVLSPILEDISKELEDIVIVKINIDENKHLSTKYKIKNIPTIILFKEGIELDKILGLKDKNEIIKKIKNKYGESED